MTGGKGMGFGFWTLALLVVANMVGAGVFTTSGFTLASLGHPGLVLLAWLVAGGVAVCGALSYGRLIERTPVSGGEYSFLADSGFPFAAFIAGWVSLLAGFSGAIAFAALALENHLPLPLPEKVTASLAIIIGATLHGRKRTLGAATQNATVLLKLTLLVAFVMAGFLQQETNDWQGVSTARHRPDDILPAFAQALVWISLSYSGFNAAVYVAGETTSPSTVRRALLVGTLTVTLLYLLLNGLFVLLPPSAIVSGQADVAALAAGWLGGANFEWFVRVVISLALLTSVLGMMMAGPRVYGKMAEDGYLPKIFILDSDRPGPPVLLQMSLALLLVFAGDLRHLLGYLGLTLSLCAAVAVLTLFKDGRSPRVRGWQAIPPVLFVTATLAAASLMIWREPAQATGTAITLIVGAIGFGIIRKPRAPSPPSTE